MNYSKIILLFLIIGSMPMQAMRKRVSSGKPFGPPPTITYQPRAAAPAAAAAPSPRRHREDASWERAMQMSIADEQARQYAAASQEQVAPDLQYEAEMARAIQESLREYQPAPRAAHPAMQALGHQLGREHSAEELPLPGTLQNLPGVDIHQIKVTQQGPDQCGSRSVANALAIQDLVNGHQLLTSANIRSTAAEYNRILLSHVVEDDTVRNMAQANHLFNAHIMSRAPKHMHGPFIPFIVQSVDTYEGSLDDVVFELRTEQTITAHFICNTGGHWVVISIIKQKGVVPAILYMDSCNSQLEDDSIAAEYIRYLYEICIQPT